MKKMIMLLMVLAVAGACTNQKVVEYNTERLNHIDEYLSHNKGISDSQNLDKLVDEGQIEYSAEYKSLESEAEEWLKNQQK